MLPLANPLEKKLEKQDFLYFIQTVTDEKSLLWITAIYHWKFKVIIYECT